MVEAMLVWVVLTFIGLADQTGALQDPAPIPRPRVPHLEWRACPYECCRYGTWTAIERVPILRDRRAGAPVLFHVAPDEIVTAETGVVITSRLGTARSLIDTTIFSSRRPVRKGGTVLVLRYSGEGGWVIWHDGVVDSWEIDEPGDPFSGSPLQMVSKPATTWWAQIKNAAGQIGWARVVDNFAGPGCGG
jgi:hypothetical protein